MLGGLALGVIHDGGGHPDGGNGGLQASGVCFLLAFILLLPFYARGLFPAGGVKTPHGFCGLRWRILRHSLGPPDCRSLKLPPTYHGLRRGSARGQGE